ncbi:hypothetical protein DPMN_108094 [Dreissena polymorpha]|uniref:Uncharacterized protein n=1 Tax=Dreissena polymorpha TaxID=45954 RepID=A0A9D4K872_DREPO|nr:hypothetical protein DPMN_108094 [Dreissena polymorpha]
MPLTSDTTLHDDATHIRHNVIRRCYSQRTKMSQRCSSNRTQRYTEIAPDIVHNES